MNQSTRPPFDLTSQAIRAERVQLLFRLSKLGQAAALFAAAIVALGFWEQASREPVLAWCALLILVTATQYLVYRIHRKRIPAAVKARRWERLFALSCASMGLTWAFLALFLFSENYELGKMLIVLAIVSVMAVSSVVLAPSTLAFWSFLAAPAIALPTQLIKAGGSVFPLVGIGVLAYAVLIIFLQRRFFWMIHDSFKTRFEKESLIKRLRRTEDTLTDAIENIPGGFAFFDRADQMVLCNSEYLRAFTNTVLPRTVIGMKYGDLLNLLVGRMDPSATVFHGSAVNWMAQEIRSHELADGEPRPFEAIDRSWRLSRSRRTKSGGIVSSHADITPLKQAEESLQRALKEQQLLFDLAMVGIVFIKDGIVVRNNARLEEMLGYGPDELVGKPPATWLGAEQMWVVEGERAQEELAGGQVYEGEALFSRRDGSRFWGHFLGKAIDPVDLSRGTIWVYADVTERKLKEQEVRFLADHDALTGLPNRRLLGDRLNQALIHARRRSYRVALMLLDLDRFKLINDTHGHKMGDEVLIAVTGRLRNCVREADTVSRQGGDEFVIVLPEIQHTEDAEKVAEKVLRAVSQPIEAGGHSFSVGVSIGISVFPGDGQSPDDLLRHADIAMYRAKEAGGNGYRFYSVEPAA